MSNYPILKKILMILLLIGVVVFVYFYFSVFVPILLALFTALLFEPFIKLFQKYTKTEKRLLAVTVTFTLFVLISGFALYLSMTKIINQITQWVYQFPIYALHIQDIVNQIILNFNDLIEDLPQRNMIIHELENQSQKLIDTGTELAQSLIILLSSWVQAIPNLLFVVLVYLITLFLFSLDLPRLIKWFYQLFKDETAEKLRYVSNRMSVVFWGYWKAQFLLSIMIFILTYVSLLFISPNLALVMTFIIWLVDIIPLYVGPALILVPWAIIVMLMGQMATGIQLIILAAVLLIIRRITEPKVLGDQMGLAALPTVLSMYFGFVFFGVAGLILGPFVLIAFRSAAEAGLFKINVKI